jgi:septal ring factor EnvC (AmiA/AmiB activator)
MSARNALFAGAFWLAFFVAAEDARSGRPPESLQAERRSLDLELDQLHKKTTALSASIDQRRDHLRRRVRALYKISQGGYLRLLLDAESPADMIARRNGVRRIVRRDLEELSSVSSELADLERDRQALRERERVAAALDTPVDDGDPGLAKKDGVLRPVKGAIIGAYGRRRDGAGLLVTRDGVEFASHLGEPVVAAAPGIVKSIEEAPGLGTVIVVDHGKGWLSLTARIAHPRVAAGAKVVAGDPLALAAGSSVQLQLTQGGQWLDPTPWLTR